MRYFNNHAAEFLPIRLIVSMIIISVITFLFISGFFRVSKEVVDNQLRQDLFHLETKLQLLVESGYPRDMENPLMNGSVRSFNFDLPDYVQFLSFGGDPTMLTEELESNIADEMMSSIVYQCEDQTKRTVWLDSRIRFIKGERINDEWMIQSIPHMFVCRNSGKFDLLFELIEKNDNIYVMIYPEY